MIKLKSYSNFLLLFFVPLRHRQRTQRICDNMTYYRQTASRLKIERQVFQPKSRFSFYLFPNVNECKTFDETHNIILTFPENWENWIPNWVFPDFGKVVKLPNCTHVNHLFFGLNWILFQSWWLWVENNPCEDHIALQSRSKVKSTEGECFYEQCFITHNFANINQMSMST